MKRIKEYPMIAILAVFLIACTTVVAAPRAESLAVPASPVQEPPHTIAAGAAPRAESQAVQPSPSQGPLRTITVVGIGKVSLVPDVAQANVGAEARADTVSEAKGEVGRQIVAIMAALKEMGIDEKEIQTSHYSIHYEREAMSILREGPVGDGEGGYRVSSMLRVAVRDVEKAGDVLDAAVEAGANQVHGVTLTVSDEIAWQGQAREKAIADAQARAGELASLTGVELGAVQSVSEVIGAWPAAMTMASMPESIIMGGGFAPGELELSTQVQVTFAIH